MLLHKIIKYAALALALVAGAFVLYTISIGDVAIQDEAAEVAKEMAAANSSDTAEIKAPLQNSTIVPLVYLTYIILAFIVGLVLVFVFKNLFSSPAVLKKSLISVGLLLAVFVIAYVVAGEGTINPMNGDPYMLDDSKELTASSSKLIGASIYAFYFLAIAAVGSIIWSGVSKMINK